MSKIEEMAEKAFPNDVGFLYLSRRTGYKRGANDALREIEKVMDLGEPPYLISAEQAYYRVMRKIQELKGE